MPVRKAVGTYGRETEGGNLGGKSYKSMIKLSGNTSRISFEENTKIAYFILGYSCIYLL